MNSTMKRKLTAIGLVASMGAVAVIGGTLAYFTDTDEVTNVFTMGNVEIDLWENEVSADGKNLITNTKVDTEQKYTMITPGSTYAKNPTVENKGDNDAYVRLKVTIENYEGFGLEEDAYQIFNAVDENTWTLSPDYEVYGSSIVYTYYHDDIMNKDDEATLFENFTMPGSVTNDSFPDGFKINVIAEAIQSENFTNADAAWTAFDTQHLNKVVNDEDSLRKALSRNGIVTISEDLTITQTLEIPAGANVVLDLNGKEIKGNFHKSEGAVIKNNGNLTITNGTVSSTANNGGSAIMNNGTLTIDGGTYNGAPNADGSWPSYTINNTGVMTVNDAKITSKHGAVCSYGAGAVLTLNNSEIDMAGIPGFTSHGMYTYDNGKIIVNSGTYANKATDQNATDGSVINGAVEIKGGTFTGRIVKYYGTPVIKGGTFTVDPTAYVASGYEVTNNGNGTWTVGAKKVSSSAEFSSAIAAGKVVELTSDVTFSSPISNDANIYLAGKTFEATSTIELKNNADLTMTGGDYKVNSTYGHIDVRPSTTEGSALVFEDVDFSYNKKGPTYGTCTDRLGSVVEVCATTADAHTKIVFRNCTFDNAKVLFEGMSDKTFK